MPTTSYPSDFNSAAVTEESTPPDMATTTRVSRGEPSRSRVLSIAVLSGATYCAAPPDKPMGSGRAHCVTYYRHSPTGSHPRARSAPGRRLEGREEAAVRPGRVALCALVRRGAPPNARTATAVGRAPRANHWTAKLFSRPPGGPSEAFAGRNRSRLPG